MKQERPYELQVQRDGQWETWSTYMDEGKAKMRFDRLAAGGKTVRILNRITGTWSTEDATPVAEECIIYCGEVHVGANTDGSCLL